MKNGFPQKLTSISWFSQWCFFHFFRFSSKVAAFQFVGASATLHAVPGGSSAHDLTGKYGHVSQDVRYMYDCNWLYRFDMIYTY